MSPLLVRTQSAVVEYSQDHLVRHIQSLFHHVRFISFLFTAAPKPNRTSKPRRASYGKHNHYHSSLSLTHPLTHTRSLSLSLSLSPSPVTRSPYLATMLMPTPPRTHPKDRWSISAKKVLSRSTHKSQQSLSSTVIQVIMRKSKRNTKQLH